MSRPKQKACMHHQRKIRHKLDIFNKTSSRILTNSSNWKLRPHLINLSSVWLSPFRSFISSLFNFQSFCLYFLSLSVCFCLSLCLSSVCLSVCLSVSLSYYCLPFPNLDLARDRSTAFNYMEDYIFMRSLMQQKIIALNLKYRKIPKISPSKRWRKTCSVKSPLQR